MLNVKLSIVFILKHRWSNNCQWK